MRNPYLTKSRFKLALDCVTQLYYTGKKQEYPDKTLDDEFLLALAKGGYQVGELAKYYYCDNPAKENISIATLDPDEALNETARRLSSLGKVVISEAAFCYKNLFIRVDLLVREGNALHIYEVKAKSYDNNDSFLNAKGTEVRSAWREYLYDVAFQRFVIRNALNDEIIRIKTHLLLVNKDVSTDINGLHQCFKVFSENNRIKVVPKQGLDRKDLGRQILIPIEVDDICDMIENEFSVPTDLQDSMSFEDFIWRSAEIYSNNERVFTPLGAKCKACGFQTGESDTSAMKSGFGECWKAAIGMPQIDRTLVTDLWGGLAGSRSLVDELIKSKKYFLHDVGESDIIPTTLKAAQGLTPHERRMEQIRRDANGISECYFDKEGLKREMNTWKYPLHMIDFETSATAIPFFKGLRPYEGVAFQFSHHTIDKDWNIMHKTQFLSFDPDSFPNFEFVRLLKAALETDKGSIFRYHNHENTFLRMIYRQLQIRPDAPADKDELMKFIDEITRDKSSKHVGSRDMIDLYKLVLQYYYPPSAKGSNSLKQILPAIILESDFLKDKYCKPGFYGIGKQIPSLNFHDHIWITPEKGFNPYKTLPKVFEEYDPEMLDLLVKDMEDVADGGTAMTAYNYLQFSEIPIDQRKKISEALLKYCELDTLAMVMLLEGWKAKLENR